MEILALIGIIIIIIGGLGLLIAAFRTSILWGIACLIISPVAIIYVILYWNEAKNPFLLQLSGVVILLISGSMGANSPLY